MFSYYCRLFVVIICVAIGGEIPPAAAQQQPQPGVITNSIGMKLTLIPAGEFAMGSPETEQGQYDYSRPRSGYKPLDEKLHRVRITKPFFMGTYTVTQEEYEKIMGKNPSWFSSGGKGSDKVVDMDTARFPVEQVSWDDAQEFCRKLSQKEGKNYRLPTEAEWEYACRAGTTTPFNFGSELNGTQANCIGNNYPYGTSSKGPYLERTTKVGSYRPNAFGLYDMHGNVWQWCEDWYGKDYYSTSPVDDPQGPVSGAYPGFAGVYRVGRGGHWGSLSVDCRTAARSAGEPTERVSTGGFRVVCER
jgi:formylglycine-generating enzyme required for sulfatase activity